MVKANELRTGNWVNSTGTLIQGYLCVTGINVEGMGAIFFGSFALSEGHLDGIPLTPEILEKCGFVNNDDPMGDFEEMYENELGDKIDKENGIYKWWHNDRYYTYVELKTLHQLQNLYFALTGEELEVKL